MDIVLIPGMWLDGAAWDDVATALVELGHRPVALTLPGQGDGDDGATFDDQVATVLAAVDAASGDVAVVGHSAACTLAWIAADARPGRVATVVLVGGQPGADGEAYFDVLDATNGVVVFPGWEQFEGPDAVDLDAGARRRFEQHIHPVPEAVATGTIRLGDERRFDLPVTLVCPEFSPDDVRGWLDAGHMPELARVQRLELVDIDSGHWPMFTRAEPFARLLAAAIPTGDGVEG